MLCCHILHFGLASRPLSEELHSGFAAFSSCVLSINVTVFFLYSFLFSCIFGCISADFLVFVQTVLSASLQEWWKTYIFFSKFIVSHYGMYHNSQFFDAILSHIGPLPTNASILDFIFVWRWDSFLSQSCVQWQARAAWETKRHRRMEYSSLRAGMRPLGQVTKLNSALAPPPPPGDKNPPFWNPPGDALCEPLIISASRVRLLAEVEAAERRRAAFLHGIYF